MNFFLIIIKFSKSIFLWWLRIKGKGPKAPLLGGKKKRKQIQLPESNIKITMKLIVDNKNTNFENSFK